VFGESDNGYGLYASSRTNAGVHAESQTSNAVAAVNHANSAAAVSAINDSGDGVWAKGTRGGYFEGTATNAVVAVNHANSAAAVSAINDSGDGVWAKGTRGGYFEGTATNAVVAVNHSNSYAAVSAINDGGGGLAGQFQGGVLITGGVRCTSDVTVDGKVIGSDVVLRGSDCAEDFDIAQAEGADPGTVMVLDCEGSLRACESAYDKKAIGVISGGANANLALF
jgi:hypothetical protein